MVSVGDLLLGASAQPIFVLIDDVQSASTADMGLIVDPPLTRNARTVNTHIALFEVPEYFAVQGRPIERSGLTCIVEPVVGFGVGALGMIELETYPEPRNVVVEAKARWLPLTDYLNPAHTQWYTYSEWLVDPADGYLVDELRAFNVGEVALYRVGDLLTDGKIILPTRSDFILQTATGSTPMLREKFGYWRAGGRVRSQSISMERGQYYWTDDINWSSPEVTVIVVAVLRDPMNEWYSILETASPDSTVLADSFSLRYTRTGSLVLWSDQVLASMSLVTGTSRPAQPVVMGFNLDMVNNTATLLAVDAEVQQTTVLLPQRIDPTSRLWLGNSPIGDQASAVMDVLEVAYFDQQYSAGALNKLLAVYDRMYGVTTS